MKANVTRGAGFRGLLNYGFSEGKNARVVGGNMAGTSPQELAAEFSVARALRPDVERPVWHCSLSAPHGEHLSAEEWEAVTASFMQKMGFEDRQFVVIKHTDKPHGHVHIVGSRIGLDGSLWHGQWEARRAIAATQQLEREFGLTLTPGLEDTPDAAPEQRSTGRGQKNPTKNELEMSDRTGDAPARLRLQELVDTALETPCSAVAFAERLEAARVRVIPNMASTGRMNGFAFELDGVRFKGSQLGKRYTWKNLQERGLEYEQERDGEALSARRDTAGTESRPVTSGDTDGVPAHGRRDGAESVPVGGGTDRSGGEGTGRVREDAQAGPPAIERDGLDGSGGSGEGPQSGDRDPGVPVDGSGRDHAPGHPDGLSRGSRTSSDEAGVPPGPLVPEPEPVSRALAVKQQLWERQHTALEADRYRITLANKKAGLIGFNLGKEKGPDGSERFFSADEVHDRLSYLSRQNARGLNVVITPFSDSFHFIVLDDLTPETKAHFLSDGYRPAYVQETSKDNFQAVLRVPKRSGRDEQKAANAMVRELNHRYGDPEFTGAIHPFRIPGFSNKKPGREDFFCRLVEAAGGVCQKALDALNGLRERFAQERRERQAKRSPASGRTPAPAPTPGPGGVRPELRAAHDRSRSDQLGRVTQQSWELDESRVDFGVALNLLYDGFSPDDVQRAILERSPDIGERHSKPFDYVTRTVQRAQIKLETLQAQRRGVERIAKDDGIDL